MIRAVLLQLLFALFFRHKKRSNKIPWWVGLLIVLLAVALVKFIQAVREEKEMAGKPKDTRKAPPSLREPIRPVPASSATVQAGQPLGAVEAEAAPPAEETTPEPAPAKTRSRPDNLKKIKGIGPKTEALLMENGITTFAQLANTEVSRLDGLLAEAGWKNIANPEAWIEEARTLTQS